MKRGGISPALATCNMGGTYAQVSDDHGACRDDDRRLLSAGLARAAENVEVLHWWTSGGEAAALDVLKKDLETKNISWTDMRWLAAAVRKP